jgi:hypothetical protein
MVNILRWRLVVGISPFERGPVPHLLGGLTGRRNRTVDVGRRCLGDVVDVLAGGGGSDLVVVITRAIGPLPGDEELEIGRHGRRVVSRGVSG